MRRRVKKCFVCRNYMIQSGRNKLKVCLHKASIHLTFCGVLKLVSFNSITAHLVFGGCKLVNVGKEVCPFVLHLLDGIGGVFASRMSAEWRLIRVYK